MGRVGLTPELFGFSAVAAPPHPFSPDPIGEKKAPGQ